MPDGSVIDEGEGGQGAVPVQGTDTRTVPLTELQRERQRAAQAKKAAEAAEARAKAAEERAAALAGEVETYKGSHEKWTAAEKAAAEKTSKALADRLATLPDTVRAEIEAEIKDGLSAAQALRWIDRAEALAGKPAAQAETAKPEGHPAGGRAATGTPAPDELTPEQLAWAKRRNLPAGQMNRATVEVLMKAFPK